MVLGSLVFTSFQCLFFCFFFIFTEGQRVEILGKYIIIYISAGIFVVQTYDTFRDFLSGHTEYFNALKRVPYKRHGTALVCTDLKIKALYLRTEGN